MKKIGCAEVGQLEIFYCAEDQFNIQNTSAVLINFMFCLFGFVQIEEIQSQLEMDKIANYLTFTGILNNCRKRELIT